MIKLVVLYNTPSDPAGFEEHYTNVHMPLAGKLPGVKRVEVGRILTTPTGAPSPYYRIAELWYDSVEELQKSFGSQEGKAVLADVEEFAAGLSTMFIAEA